MEKEPAPRSPRVDPPERDDVRVVANRCPFCHEDVAREAADVCRDCLARHHPACWTEGGRCGACGSVHALRPAPEPSRAAGHVVLASEMCGDPKCDARGVAQANLNPMLFCRAHARHYRRLLTGGAVVIALLGVAPVIGGVAWAIGEEHPLPLVLSVVGVAILAFGVYLSSIPRRLPPIPEEP